jgi:hypothetical protein
VATPHQRDGLFIAVLLDFPNGAAGGRGGFLTVPQPIHDRYQDAAVEVPQHVEVSG